MPLRNQHTPFLPDSNIYTFQPISYDTLNFPGLLEVYAPSFENDLSSIIGGGPAILSPGEWIEQAKVVLSNFSATQHIIT